ncbi:MAG: peptidase [Alteromonadaceae bacterium]|nr:peptidase [Alteromonadaceae bacterium]
MINYHFIEMLEGFSTEGYIPDLKRSRSGVTIACGFDLGQCSPEQLSRAFIPALARQLVPFAGLTQYKAYLMLQKQPLSISKQQAEVIVRYCHRQATKRLIKRWKKSNSDIVFEQLSDECQTIIASVAFQYGNLAKRTPNFWYQVTTGHWTQALNNLRAFGDNYATRRNKEANLLQKWLKYKHTDGL